MYPLPSLLLSLLCILSILFAVQASEAKEFPPFSLAFPKPIDTLVARTCDSAFCSYLFVFAGWIRDGEDMMAGYPFSLRVRLDGAAEAVLPAETTQHRNISPYSVFFEWKTKIVVPIDVKLISLESSVMNKFEEVIFTTRNELVLLQETDYPLPALAAQYELFTASSSSPRSSSFTTEDGEKLVPVLDFIEIGTSDFATILQQASQHQSRFRGFSIEAIAQYQASLPNPPNVLKINAAIMPEALSDNSTVAEVFFVPPSIVHSLGEETAKWMRGCSQIDDVHVAVMSEMAASNISPNYLQKQPVRVLTMNYLLSQLLFTKFSGLNLLKIDVEGLDMLLIKDFIDYYEHTLHATVDDARWPCVVTFELNHLNSADRNTTDHTLQRLKDVGGYSLLSEVMDNKEIFAEWERSGSKQALITSLDADVFAYRCRCPRERLDNAAELMLPDQYDMEFLSFACSLA